MHRIEIGKRIGRSGNISLQSVNENIHAGDCRDCWGYRAGKTRVKYSHVGQEQIIDEGNLHLAFGIGNDAESGHFGAGATGCWNHH